MPAAVIDALVKLVKMLVGCRVMGMVIAHKFPKTDGNSNWDSALGLQPAQMAGINLVNVAKGLSHSNRMSAGQHASSRSCYLFLPCVAVNPHPPPLRL